MGKQYTLLTPSLQEFIEKQKLFIVASAPLYGQYINASPKGHSSYGKVVDPTHFIYLEMNGSGNETISHVRETGRMSVMFMSFIGAPLILRIYGRGIVHLNGSKKFDEYCEKHYSDVMADFPYRSIIELEISFVTTSCGFAVPTYEYIEDRQTLINYNIKLSDAALDVKKREWNTVSLDGLPGLPEFDSTLASIFQFYTTMRYRLSPPFYDTLLLATGFAAGICTLAIVGGKALV